MPVVSAVTETNFRGEQAERLSKLCDGRPDRQTDRQTPFRFYLIEDNALREKRSAHARLTTAIDSPDLFLRALYNLCRRPFKATR